MKTILQNMALFLLTDFCKANKINCAGTYCVKDGRGFSYKLVDQETGQRTIAQSHGSRFTKAKYQRTNSKPLAGSKTGAENTMQGKVMIIGRSAFAGSVGHITGQGKSAIAEMVHVTLTHCGRLYENVPFLPRELYQMIEAQNNSEANIKAKARTRTPTQCSPSPRNK